MADEVSISISSILKNQTLDGQKELFHHPPSSHGFLSCSAFLNPRLNFCLRFLGEYVSRSIILFLLFPLSLPLLSSMKILAQIINNIKNILWGNLNNYLLTVCYLHQLVFTWNIIWHFSLLASAFLQSQPGLILASSKTWLFFLFHAHD